MIYKDISEADAAFLVQLFSNEEYQLYFAENETTVSEWQKRIQEYYSTKYSYIVCTDAGSPVGWIMYDLVCDVCNLDIIALLHTERFKGYGKIIFDDLIDKHEEIKEIRLDVQARNKNAVNFYSRMGFVKIDEELQPVGDREELYYKMSMRVR